MSTAAGAGPLPDPLPPRWFARWAPLPAGVALPAQPAAALHGQPLWLAEDGSECCAYLPDAGAATPPPGLLALPGLLSLVRLAGGYQRAGAAAGRDAPWHYIVATDVQTAAEADFNAWYDAEHLPGLAAVPGTARAQRCQVALQAHGRSPRYHAAYDLAERSAFNGPAWLAVRGTDWSSRVRPHFTNTRRTMYARMA